MRTFLSYVFSIFLLLFSFLPGTGMSAEIERFEGSYAGKAEFVFNNEQQYRDMSTTITATKKGFVVRWTSVTYKTDGRTKEKTYTIDFVPSARDHIYKSAMATNRFGKPTPLDPMQGEPFVWSRIDGDTLSVYSLFINEIGEYELQEFHRTLVEEGLELKFLRVHNGVAEKEIRTLLRRLD